VKNDRLYVAHIIESVEMIQRWIASEPRGFFENEMMQEAVLRRMQTLAESSKRLSDAAKAQHPEVEWKEIADFRNVMVHDYTSLRLAGVWEIIETDLPGLLAAVKEIEATLP
jgi:uncharacterized protein with HEPN domain